MHVTKCQLKLLGKQVLDAKQFYRQINFTRIKLTNKKVQMKPKLKFLLPDIKTAHLASEALLLARVDDKNITFLAKPGTDLGKLQAAGTLDSTNMINDGEKGIMYGAIVGLLIGLYIFYFEPWVAETVQIHVAVIVAIATIIGAMASAIGAAVFGVNMFNTDLNKFKHKIDDGAVLMIVSVPFQRSAEVRKIVKNLHLKF